MSSPQTGTRPSTRESISQIYAPARELYAEDNWGQRERTMRARTLSTVKLSDPFLQ